jgi:hypothetical protein
VALLPAGSYTVSADIPARLGGVAEKTIIVKDHVCSVQRFAAARRLDPATPGGYSLEVYSSKNDAPKHLIENGATFRYLDPSLGKIERGDLKVKIILTGAPPSIGQPLEVQWLIDGRIVHGRLVNPNTIDEPGDAEPIRGSYKVVLRLDNEFAEACTFRIE